MWVDQLAEELLRHSPGPHVVNDAKTPSGHVPVGSLRGVLMHDCVARALRDAGVETSFVYGFDDYDPMDDLPPSLPEYARYMGMPFSTIPSPDGLAPSYGHYYAAEFAGAFQRLGAHPDDLPHHRDVPRGQVRRRDPAGARSGGTHSRDLPRRRPQQADRRPVVAGAGASASGAGASGRPASWRGTAARSSTSAQPTRWRGPRGAGTAANGARSAAASKLLYRVEWPAKWSVLGVTVEGAGKDHMTRGGTHDVARAISEQVFGRPAPFSFAYEFVLYGGKKMSTSKAVGATASEILEVLRAELARFLIVRPLPRRQVEFDPAGETIPNLYDEYDRAAAAFYPRC